MNTAHRALLVMPSMPLNGWPPSRWRTTLLYSKRRSIALSAIWGPDMIRQLLDSLRGDTSYGALRRRLAALEQENARLRLNVARLQVENRHLRRSAELT